jgi:hypothetical protein
MDIYQSFKKSLVDDSKQQITKQNRFKNRTPAY